MFSSFKKRWNSKFLLAVLIGLFVILQLMIVSSSAQESSPLYGKIEKVLCGNDLPVSQIADYCLVLFEAIDGSPKYGILYDQFDFYFKNEKIDNAYGYIDRNYFQLLKSSALLLELKSFDDSYFYVKSRDNGYNSIAIVNTRKELD